MPLPPDAKAELRRTIRDRRRRYVTALPDAVRALAFRRLPSPVAARIKPGMTVALYHAVADEAPTAGIADQLDEMGITLALPRPTTTAGEMLFARWDPDRILVPGPFRTLSPDRDAPVIVPDVIVAPLLAFDAALNRLGQGGGYYDRVFAAYPDALRIGLAWSVQQVESLPVDAHDVPLHMLVTEQALFERDED